MQLNDTTYDLFVKELLNVLSPLWPYEPNRAAAFSGSSELGKDEAIVYGTNAEYLSSLGRALAGKWGIDASHYKLDYTLVKHEPMLKHSAYARNINRWMNEGTLPRKRAARADLVLVAVCWLFSWGDEGRESARKGLQGRFCISESDGADPLSMAIALYERSLVAYANSRKARRAASSDLSLTGPVSSK